MFAQLKFPATITAFPFAVMAVLLFATPSFAYEDYPIGDLDGRIKVQGGHRGFGISIDIERNPAHQATEYPVNQAERPLTVPEGILEMGTGFSVEKTYPTENSSRGLLPLRYGITDDLELQALGLKYRFMLDNRIDAEFAVKARVAGAGHSAEGGSLWITDGGIDGKIGFNQNLAILYQVDDYHTFYSLYPEKDLVGASLLGVACFSDHFAILTGGSYQALTGYTVKSAGYYTLRILVNSKKFDFMVEGLWSNSNEYINMRDLERLSGKETYTGMVYWRF